MLAILAAVMLAAAAPNDTVFTSDGGRVIGTVIEEGPQAISVQLPDGTTRRLARGEVTRIEYADGSVSTPSRPAPPPPAYRAPPQPPPPAYRPPPQPAPPAYRPPPPQYAPYPPSQPPPPAYAGPGKRPPLVPFYGSFGLGGMFLGGSAWTGASGQSVAMEELVGSQLGVWLDTGVRLTPHLGLGLYLDWGVGDPAGETARNCSTLPGDCTATTGRFGVLMKHTFEPYASSTPWLAIGTGFEWGNVSVDYDGGGYEELASFEGWEMLRLMGGVDLRTNPVFGFGLYAGVSWGRYTNYDDALGHVDIDGEKTHTTIEAGLRFTLFP